MIKFLVAKNKTINDKHTTIFSRKINPERIMKYYSILLETRDYFLFDTIGKATEKAKSIYEIDNSCTLKPIFKLVSNDGGKTHYLREYRTYPNTPFIEVSEDSCNNQLFEGIKQSINALQSSIIGLCSGYAVYNCGLESIPSVIFGCVATYYSNIKLKSLPFFKPHDLVKRDYLLSSDVKQSIEKTTPTL